jgi:hypothetical protein
MNSPYADPEKAALRLMELAKSVEPLPDGRIHIRTISRRFLFEDMAWATEYMAGMKLAHRARLALDAWERDLCKDHARRREAVRRKERTK